MNFNDILNNRSPELKDLFEAVEQISQNIQSHASVAKPSISGEYYLDNIEACKMLHISSRTLQDYRDKGLISFYKLEGKILYKLSDIQEMLEKHYNDAWRLLR